MKNFLIYSISLLLLCTAGCKKSSDDGPDGGRKIRIKKVTFTNNDGSVGSSSIYGYDEDGNLIIETTSPAPGKPGTYGHINYQYENGKLIRKSIADIIWGSKEISYIYNGELLQEAVTLQTDFNKLIEKEVYGYNTKGQKTETRFYIYDPAEVLSYTEKYTYNSDAKIDVKTIITTPYTENYKHIYDPNKNLIETRKYTSSETDFVVTYQARFEYDATGKIKAWEVIYDNPPVSERHEESYNAEGRITESVVYSVQGGNKIKIGVIQYEYVYYK